MVLLLNYDVKISEFEPQLFYYVYNPTDVLGIVMNALILPVMG